MSDIVKRARELVANATASNPLPWRQCCQGSNPACWHMVWAAGEQEMTVCKVTRHEGEHGDNHAHRTPADARALGAFFESAPTLITSLADEVERLQERVEYVVEVETALNDAIRERDAARAVLRDVLHKAGRKLLAWNGVDVDALAAALETKP